MFYNKVMREYESLSVYWTKSLHKIHAQIFIVGLKTFESRWNA